MPYPQTIQYLDSFVNYEKKTGYPYKQSFKLERIEEFLKVIGNPQEGLKCIHVAGTKGKGSVCILTAYVLKEAGYKVGLYTSPHFSSIRERIRILSCDDPMDMDFCGMVSEEELEELVSELKPEIDSYNNASSCGPLTFFEVYTALGLLYFKRKKVDFVVLETGLGGRLDATNVVNPLICSIPSISYDHAQKLGDTLSQIAKEKCGIIKRNSLVISAPQSDEAMRVIRDVALTQEARLYTVGKDLNFQTLNSSLSYQEFNFNSELGELNNLKIKLLGRHQLVNACVAIGLLLGLKKYCGVKILRSAFKKGFLSALWPGRFEVVSKNPWVVLDGAHNADSARVLKDAVRNYFPDKKVILILGVSKDKDIKGICSELSPLASRIILTRAKNDRSLNPDELPLFLEGLTKLKPQIVSNAKEAFKKANDMTRQDSLILISGSLYLVAEAREFILGGS